MGYIGLPWTLQKATNLPVGKLLSLIEPQDSAQDVYVNVCLPIVGMANEQTAGYSGGDVVNTAIASQVPDEVAHPKGKTSFALEDGIYTQDKPFSKQASVDVEAVGDRTSSVIEQDAYPTPTEDEVSTLRKVADSIPKTAWLL